MTFPFAVSQRGTTIQRIGVTDVTFDYGRPAVNEREIWGGLVPYDQVWRCGANENTAITFSTDVTVNGTKPTVDKASATFEMRWENIAVPFTIGVDLEQTVSENLSRQLTGLAGFTPTNYVQTATWLVQNDMNIPLAKKWAARANGGTPTFASLMLAAQISDIEGNTSKAKEFREQAEMNDKAKKAFKKSLSMNPPEQVRQNSETLYSHVVPTFCSD